jgi:hypothetical protein
VSFRLIINPEAKQGIDLLAAAHQRYEAGERTPENERASKEFQEVMKALRALRDGRRRVHNSPVRRRHRIGCPMRI